MENEKKNLFERPEDLRDTDIYDAINKVRSKREDMSLYFSLKEIKHFAGSIRKNYLITQEKDKDQIIGDQFLDRPYFGFIAEVWDYPEPFSSSSPLKDYLKLANELVKAGYTVKTG